MADKITIKDVAIAAGVSIGTVDRVVHKRGHVSVEAENMVKQAIKELNYKPSQVARALVTQNYTKTIGISIMGSMHNFYEESLSGIRDAQKRLEMLGVNIIVDQFRKYTEAEQKKSLQRLLDAKVNAILLTPVEHAADWIEELIPSNIPYGTVIDDVESPRKLFHIGPDDYAMGAMLAKLGLLYTGNQMSALVVAANMGAQGTIKRVKGFTEKAQCEAGEKAAIRVYQADAEDEEEANIEIFSSVLDNLQNDSAINTIYVTNGSAEWAAAAAKKADSKRKLVILGHEHTEKVISMLREGKITASVDQKPGQQWNDAVHLMSDFLFCNISEISPVNRKAECSILIAESLPLSCF